MSSDKAASSIPEAFDVSVSIKIVEVAKKYNEPEGRPILRIPEYTIPGGPNGYHCSKVDHSWTQGFFPGMIWLLVERMRLDPSTVDSSYTEDELIALARRWQDSFRHLARPSLNHDQGFRFQLSFGRDYALTGSEDAKGVMITASDSLDDRFSDTVGAIRSWDQMVKVGAPDAYTERNMDKHYLTIIDNMMNLDMLYEATKLTGNPRYAEIANRQAEASLHTHIREDYTTYHVVNFDQQNPGQTLEKRTHQGYADESVWARGQAWGIYGYAQCAIRTGRADFLLTSRKLADRFLELLGPSGVPEWDFSAPKPCPYDASAGTITARGLQMLYQLLVSTEPDAAKEYLARSVKLIQDVVKECGTPKATLDGGKVNWGEGDWETILQHSTINGNERATKRLMDHGLIYADYYFVEYGNEALKMKER